MFKAEKCYFDQNQGQERAALSANCNDVILQDNTFSNNKNLSGYFGGGAVMLNVPGDAGSTNDILVENNIFLNNLCSGSVFYGGALNIKSSQSISSIAFTGQNQFVNNEVQGKGGAVYIECPNIDTVTFQDIVLKDSTKAREGGFLYLSCSYLGQLTISGTNANSQEILCKATNGDGGFATIVSDSLIHQVSIQSNHLSTSIATMSGGFLAISSHKINALNISENVLDSCKAGASGGLLALDIDYINTLFLNQNTAGIRSVAGLNGGFLFGEGSHFNNIHIEGNIVSTATAGSNGGLVYLDIDTTGHLYFKSNVSHKNEAGSGDGGCFYIEGDVLGQVDMTDNDISEKASAHNGAVGYFNSGDRIGEFNYLNNKSGDNTAASSGGVLFVTTSICGPVAIRNNQATGHTKADGGNGGFLFLDADSCTSLEFVYNTVNDSAYAKGNGAMVYFMAGTKVSSVTCDHNNANNAVVANGSGGIMSVTAPGVTLLSFSGNTVTQSSSSGLHGGSLFLDIAGDVESVTIQNNEPGNCTAVNGNGGFANLNVGGSLMDMTIMNNTIATAGAQTSGGTFFVDVGHLIGDAMFNGNTVTAGSTASNGYGGTVMIRADSCQNLSFLNNVVSGSSVASLDGGMIYLEINKSITVLDITGNTCRDAKSNGGSGGMVYISLPSLGSLNFAQNAVTSTSTASINGGCLSLNVAGTIGEVDVTDNQAGSSTALGGNGGFINIQSDSCHKLILTGNHINQLGKASQNGGILFLETNKEINAIELSGNTSGSAQATAGNGGWGCFTVPSIGYLDFSQNIISSTASSGLSGGCLYISIAGSIDSVLVRSNQTGTCQALAGDGGVIYLKTGNKPDVVELSDNTMKTAGAVNGSGGVAYISLPSAGYLKFSHNTVTDSTRALQNGGCLYFLVDADADSIAISSNITGKSLTATGNGGYADIQIGGTLGKLDLFNNSCTSSRAGNSGGYLNLEAGDIGDISCHDEVISGMSMAQSGRGGYLNLTTSGDMATFDYTMNEIASSYAGDNGGVISVTADHTGDLSIHGNENNNNPFSNAMAGKDGGAVYLDCQSEMMHFNLSQNVFHNTTCGGAGGAVFILNGLNSGSSTVSISGNVFNDPATALTTLTGGGIYADNIHNLLITDCVFENLVADSLGGAITIVNVDSVTLLSNNTFIHNSSGLSSGTPVINEATGGAAYFNNINYLIISGNEFTGNATTFLGGAICCEDISEGTLTDNKFLNNRIIAGNSPLITKGGGLYSGSTGILQVSQNIFEGNDAMQGGGLYLDNSGVLIDGNTISNNGGLSEIITIDGGGAYVNESHGIVSHNMITSNAVLNSGGGLYVRHSGSPGQDMITVNDNFIFDNQARLGGGVLSENMPVLFIRDHISRNKCSNSNYSNINNGAGVCLTARAAASTFYNCIIYKNIIASELNRGSGIYIDPTGTDGSDSTRIINCTIYENNFYGLYLKAYETQQTDKCKVLNSILYSNNTLLAGSNTFNEQQANFENPDIVTDYSLICPLPEYPHGDSIFCTSPGFMDYSVYPDPTSACINKGQPLPQYDDIFFPPSYLPERNDIGVTGGPYAFTDTTALFLDPLPTLTALFDVAGEECLTFTFKPKDFVVGATYIWIIDDNYYTEGYDPQTGTFVFDFLTTGTHQVCLYAEETFQNTVISDQICLEVYIPFFPPVVDPPYVCDHSPHITIQHDTLFIKQSHFAYSPTVQICASYTIPVEDEAYYHSTWMSLPDDAVKVNAMTDSTLDLTILEGILNDPGLPVVFEVNSTVGCPGSTSTYILKVESVNDVGMEEPAHDPMRVNISPNPASGMVRVEMTGDLTGEVIMSLYSLDDKCLLQKTWTKSDFILQESLDLKNISPGVYIVLIKSGNVELHFKLVIT
jgi:hypothetical protein